MTKNEKVYLYELAKDFGINSRVAKKIIENATTYEEARKKILHKFSNRQAKRKVYQPRTSSAVRFV